MAYSRPASYEGCTSRVREDTGCYNVSDKVAGSTSSVGAFSSERASHISGCALTDTACKVTWVGALVSASKITFIA